MPNLEVGVGRRRQLGGRGALVDEQDDDVGFAVRVVAVAELVGDAVGRVARVADVDVAMPAGLTSEGSSSVTAPTKPIVTPSKS